MRGTSEVHFDGWTLRVDSGELTRDGRTIRLQTQPLQVLEALLEHPGDVVRREQLVARLWPNGIVDFDTALNSAVRRLRHALDDVADAPRYVETLPRRGYRFIGNIEAPGREGAARAVARMVASRKPLLRLAALTALFVLALASLVLGQDSRVRPPPPRDALVVAHASRAHNPEAASRYREARYFYEHRAPGDLERARNRFEQAVALKPDFAEAYAGLSSAYFLLAMDGGIDRDAGFESMRAAAERAIALNPRIAEAHYRLSTYDRFGNHPREADMERRKAMALDPTGALTLSMLASKALSEGRVEEAVELSRRAVVAEPLALVYRYNLAATLFLANRIEEAKQANLEALELNPDFNSDIAAMAMILEGEFEPALALISKWPDGPLREECLALAYYGLNRIAEANVSLAALIRAAGRTDPLRIVEVYAYRGDRAAAFQWLDVATTYFSDAHAIERASVWPWMLRLSPFVASLRGEPQWNAWIETLGTPAPLDGSR